MCVNPYKAPLGHTNKRLKSVAYNFYSWERRSNLNEIVPAITIQQHVKELLIKTFRGDLEVLKKSGMKEEYGETSFAMRVFRSENQS